MATDRRLEDRVAVVTGSGSGTGRGSAIVLARAGARIIVNDTDTDGGAETVSLIREAGGGATLIAARCLLYRDPGRSRAVLYTHLPAHETRHDLLFRLLP